MDDRQRTESFDAVIERIEARRQRGRRFGDTRVTSAHGAGGKAAAALFDAVIAPALATNEQLKARDDAAVLDVGASRIALTTDAFVVWPRVFPGGSLGELAVNGTLNDLAVSGARPLALSLAMVIEEGFAIDELRAVLADAARAAEAAGVPVVTGDTKVVQAGGADGIFLVTTGVGVVGESVAMGADRVSVGDVVIVSGALGDHGVAVMLARGELELASEVRSDTACLWPAVEALLAAVPETRFLRDATRGGVATVLNELAMVAGVGILIEEESLPVHAPVRGALELLGIDPLHVANEGKFVAVVPAETADAAIEALRSVEVAAESAVIGRVVDEPHGVVVVRNQLGGTHLVDMLVGDPLPRIC